jgi:hypothetical protein
MSLAAIGLFIDDEKKKNTSALNAVPCGYGVAR